MAARACGDRPNQPPLKLPRQGHYRIARPLDGAVVLGNDRAGSVHRPCPRPLYQARIVERPQQHQVVPHPPALGQQGRVNARWVPLEPEDVQQFVPDARLNFERCANSSGITTVARRARMLWMLVTV